MSACPHCGSTSARPSRCPLCGPIKEERLRQKHIREGLKRAAGEIAAEAGKGVSPSTLAVLRRLEDRIRKLGDKK